MAVFRGFFPHVVQIFCLVELFNIFVIGTNTDITGAYTNNCSSHKDCSGDLVCTSGKCDCPESYVFATPRGCRKVCEGTNWASSSFPKRLDYYNFYKDRYTGCEFVKGNLEIVNLKQNYDLGFLKDIEEITGYLLVKRVFSNYLNLTGLAIIRGQTLYELRDNHFVIFFANNYNPHNKHDGIYELQLQNLKDISGYGDIAFRNNFNLCFHNTVNWGDFDSRPTLRINDNRHYPKRQCPPCADVCRTRKKKKAHCFGSGENMCQILTSDYEGICSYECDYRCVINSTSECCHYSCLGGCSGPKPSDCFACSYDYKGSCLHDCPKTTFKRGHYCFDRCPGELVANNGVCLPDCPIGKHPNPLTNICEVCDGPCPAQDKKCPGVTSDDFVSSLNIESFRGCTIVEGNIRLLQVTFTGDPHYEIKGISTSDLEILKTVEHVKGYVLIQETPSDVEDLSFLSSLKTIHGKQLARGLLSLTVMKTDIRSLGLLSLASIENGDVLVALNRKLCDTDTVNWNYLFPTSNQTVRIMSNKQNCTDAQELTCHNECINGCWGPGKDECFQPKDTCTLYRRTDFVYTNDSGCRSKEKITTEYCRGHCGETGAHNYIVFLVYSHYIIPVGQKCKSCVGILAEEPEAVPVVCGEEETTAYFWRIKECNCQSCGPNIQ